jgi:hypothetical protein
MMMESTGIPMPGETILIGAALAGTKHALDIRGVIAAAAGEAIVGANIGFWVGREFGEPLLEKWDYLVGLDARKRLLGWYLFARYGGGSRLIPKIPRSLATRRSGNGLTTLRISSGVHSWMPDRIVSPVPPEVTFASHCGLLTCSSAARTPTSVVGWQRRRARRVFISRSSVRRSAASAAR